MIEAARIGVATQAMRPLKVDVVVHGRFHGFALTKALLELGHDAIVYTNYPKSVVERFGVPARNVRSFLAHGLGTRAAGLMGRLEPRGLTEPFFHKAFGQWAARHVRKDADLIYGFSGVVEELLRSPRENAAQVRIVMRGSAHIREQNSLLEEEERRVGVPINRPSEWMIAREEREYELADHIAVLSRFAYESFVSRSIPARRLILNPLGVDPNLFRASREALAARERRILSGQQLRVLNVGTLSAQKGTYDLVQIASQLRTRFRFDFVGTIVEREVGHILRSADGALNVRARVPESELASVYAEADLFVFTTIHDGFAAVLLQATASGLPILATPNCSAPDFVVENDTGWILPVRNTQAFISRLVWCDQNRPALARMTRRAAVGEHAQDWKTMANELVNAYCSMKGWERRLPHEL